MGSSNSQSNNPSVFQYTFTKVHGEPSVINIEGKENWDITRITLYQVPIDIIAHFARTAHYFLLFDIEYESHIGHIVCHFTEDGVKHLDFHSSRSEAIFGTFEGIYLTSKIELIRYSEIQGKKVIDLIKAFDEWDKPFNLILSNCRNFARFIESKFFIKTPGDD